MALRILITAGPTREMLDPVRFISNLSTGEMGYQLAREATRLGNCVTLVSGPTGLEPPKDIRFIPVVSAKDMERAVVRNFASSDALLMTAAVCDFTPSRFSRRKIKRKAGQMLFLKKASDILGRIASRKGKRFVVGFCLETEDLEKNAVRKLREKHLDLIVANRVSARHDPFGRRQVSVLLVDRDLKKNVLSNCTKQKIARRLLKLVERGCTG